MARATDHIGRVHGCDLELALNKREMISPDLLAFPPPSVDGLGWPTILLCSSPWSVLLGVRGKASAKESRFWVSFMEEAVPIHT